LLQDITNHICIILESDLNNVAQIYHLKYEIKKIRVRKNITPSKKKENTICGLLLIIKLIIQPLCLEKICDYEKIVIKKEKEIIIWNGPLK